MSQASASTEAPQRPFRNSIVAKVYVVLLPDNLAPKGKPNVKVITAKFTRGAAQAVVDTMPGSFIEKAYCDKYPGITPPEFFANKSRAAG